MTLKILHQIVGKTNSGKIVFCALDSKNVQYISEYMSVSSFSLEDLLDSYALFEYLSIRAQRRVDSFAEIYSEHSSEIRKMLSPEDFEKAKFKAGVVTVFDLRILGEILASIEFKDP